jgi:hypothetical protein
MAAFGGLVLTIKGRNLQAKVQAGQQLKFSRMGLGDGVITSQSIPNMTGLITERKSIAVNRVYTPSAGRATVSAILSNQDITTGFFFRELGIFALDPDEGEIMYAYGNSGSGSAEYIPPGGGADVIEKLINVNLLVGNATNISITADPSQVYVSLQDYTAYTTNNDVNILDLKARMTTAETDVDNLQDRLNNVDTKQITLAGGVQVLNSIKSALFSLDGITGRMLVNLLGRMGNCETVGSWSSNVAIGSDTTNKTSGTSSFKLTLGSVPATASASFLTTPSKKYIAVADVKNGNTSKVAISINGIAGANGNDVAAASAFAPSVVRFAATDFFHIVTVTGTGNSGSTFNMDSVRVYEVSDTDYAAAASYTAAQAAAKWPYVDSVMPVRNPYAIRYGENLLPSFYGWTSASGKMVVNSQYNASFTRSGAGQNMYIDVNGIGGQAYTFTINSDVAATCEIQFYDKNLATVGSPVIKNDNLCQFTAPPGTAVIRVVLYTLSGVSGTVTFTNPMLNIGSTAKPFKPREDSMLALQTDLYADPVTGDNADTVYERDGQYFKSKKWRGMTLDGNLAWALGEGSPASGNKQVKVSGLAVGAVAGSGIGTKYDGKLLPQGSTGSSTDTNAVTAVGEIYLGIPAVDSGWADGYTPTQDEIKAYFLGWNMYYWNGTSAELYNNQGPKSWRKINNHGATTSTLPTTQIEPGLSKDGRFVYWEPYKLVYQLATPTVEPIVSEGKLTFTEGDNQVEVGTGIVLREPSKPVPYQEGAQITNRWAMNKLTSSSPNPFKNLPRKALQVYGNGFSEPFNTGTTGDLTNWYGGVYIDQLYAYTPEKSYSVTYLMAASSPVVPFTGSYAANEKTLLSGLVDSVQQNTARVSVLENKKADKDNPAWITPTTLLNGWVSMGMLGYRKIDNKVQVKARIKSGVIGQPFMVLPEGYRPLVGQVRPVHSYTTTDVFAAVLINADGKFIVSGGSNNEVNIYLEFTLD